MIRLIVYSNLPQSPSWEFYSSLLTQSRENDEFEIKCIVGNDSVPDHCDADALLLFGSGFDVKKIRERNAGVVLGHLEPRAAQYNDSKLYDFLVLNSIESADYFAERDQPTFIYPTFPIMLGNAERKKSDNKKLIIGYHGNKIHLQAMFPRITDAMTRLRREFEFDFYAMYNIDKLGKWDEKGLRGVNVKHIQFEYSSYLRYMAQVDIGIIPQLIPVRRSKMLRWFMGTVMSKYNERHDNFFLRFKETTNNGRAFVFAQYGIPIVADLTPSSCALLGENEYGYVAYTSNQWFNMLKKLSYDRGAREHMGILLNNRFNKLADPDKLNHKLIGFIKALMESDASISL